MAREATIDVKINSKDGQKSMDDLGKSVDSVEQEVRDLDGELSELTDKLKTMDSGTEEFREMEKEAGNLKRQIDDVDDRVTTLSSDTLAMDQATGVIEGMAGAYMAVQGAVALMGVESEELLQVLVKLQAVQAVVNGLNQVSNTLSKRSAAGILLRNIRTKILNATMTTHATVTGASTVATKALNVALKSLPFVAIVGAISGLIYALYDYTSASDDAGLSTEELKQKQEELRQQQLDNRTEMAKNSTEFVTLIYQLKQTNESSNDRLDLINKINDTYGTTLKNLEDERDFQNQLNQSIQNYIKVQEDKIRYEANEERITELLVERIRIQDEFSEALKTTQNIYELGARDAIQRNQANLRAGKISKEQYNETNKGIRESINNEEEYLKLQGLKRIGLSENVAQLEEINRELESLSKNQIDLSIDDSDSGSDTDTDTDTDPDTDPFDREPETDKAIANYIKANQKFFDAIEADRISRIEDAREKELQVEATNYDNLIQLAEEAGMETTDITEKYQQLVQEINDKYDNEAKNKKAKLNADTLLLQEKLLREEELNQADSEEEKQKIREKYSQPILDLRKKQLMQERDMLLENTKLTEEERSNIIAEYALKNEKLISDSVSISDDENAEIQDKWYQSMDGILSTTSNVMTEIGGLLDTVHNMQMQSLEQENAKRQSNYESMEMSYKTALEGQEITRKEYDAKMKVLNQKKKNEDLIARREQFQLDKKSRITTAIMGIAQGVISGLGAPFPLNLVMPAIAAATGAIQLATIKQQKFTANNGGIVPGEKSNVDSVDAKLAPGEAVINANSSQMFAPLLSQINQLGGGKSLLPSTELKSEPSNSTFDNGSGNRSYVVFNDIKQAQSEDDRYRRNGRV